MDSAYHYHAGEREVQHRTSEEGTAARNSAIIADAIPAGAVPFLARQPFVVFGTRDATGAVWASPVFGEPGFVTAPNPHAVHLDLKQSFPVPGDTLWENAAANPSVGMVALELATRRRLRVNGKLRREGDRAILAAEWAYPNCSKYIQRRGYAGITRAPRPQSVETGETLTPDLIQWVRGADTLFVASAHPDQGADCSHRGGHPGFVEVRGDGGQELRIPDYSGNSMYNTLGNFLVNPRAGIVFLDFENGQVLSLTGDVHLDWDVPGTEKVTTDTRRYWRVTIRQWRRAVLPTFPVWRYVDSSPHNPGVAVPFAPSPY